MDKMIAICGTVCSECPALLATQKDDDAERKRIAEAWSKQYNADIKPEDINCDGCMSGGKRLFFYGNYLVHWHTLFYSTLCVKCMCIVYVRGNYLHLTDSNKCYESKINP